MPTKYTRKRYRDEAEEVRERLRPQWLEGPNTGPRPQRQTRVILLTLPVIALVLFAGPRVAERLLGPQSEKTVLPGVVLERFIEESAGEAPAYALRVEARLPGEAAKTITRKMRVAREAWGQLPPGTAVRLAALREAGGGYTLKGIALALEEAAEAAHKETAPPAAERR